MMVGGNHAIKVNGGRIGSFLVGASRIAPRAPYKLGRSCGTSDEHRAYRENVEAFVTQFIQTRDDPVFRKKVVVVIRKGWSPQLIAGRWSKLKVHRALWMQT
jgi:hypothetical protein